MKLLGTAIALSVLLATVDAVPAAAPVKPTPTARPRMTMQPLIRSANECIARKVATDPRFGASTQGGNVNDLIVESIPSCLDAVRAMIDEHDHIYGEGTGENFFVGPYLDALPAAVNGLVKDFNR
jgi:hypothetical protein